MANVERKCSRSAVLRVALATGLGVIFGIQGWRLAQYGFPVSLPWYGGLWVFVRHVALGFSLGVMSSSVAWWKRGLIFGALFSLPSAVAVRLMDPAGLPRAFALCAANIAAGMLIAFLTDSICPSKREKPPEDISAALKRAGLDAGREGKRPVAAQRLSTAMAQLERIQAERQRLGDPGFGRVAEDRIVWSELLELELQDTDHQVSPHHGEDTGSQD